MRSHCLFSLLESWASIQSERRLPPSLQTRCYSSVSASRGEITANLLFISNIPLSLCESNKGGQTGGGGFQSLRGCVFVLVRGPWVRSLSVWWVWGGVLRRALRTVWGMLRGFQVSLSSRLQCKGLQHGLQRVQGDHHLSRLMIGEECVDGGRLRVVPLSSRSFSPPSYAEITQFNKNLEPDKPA